MATAFTIMKWNNEYRNSTKKVGLMCNILDYLGASNNTAN